MIVAADAAQALRAQPGFKHDVLVFADVDALQAQDAIVRRRPLLVVLDRAFVGVPRGAELIARVRADPDLSHAQIRVLADVGAYADLVARRLKAGLPPATALPGELLPAEFDGTRRARRVRIQTEVEAQVDDMLGTLVDLSPTGAQVVGLNAVRPFQHVKVSIRDKHGLVRCRADVAWVTFEPTSDGYARGYRAGPRVHRCGTKSRGGFLRAPSRAPATETAGRRLIPTRLVRFPTARRPSHSQG